MATARSRRKNRTRGSRSVWMGLVLGLLLAVPSGGASPADEEASIRARLDAGEFAPAIAAIRRLPRIDQRDALLAQVAAAQARAGARDASLNTASQIDGDRARAGALSHVANQPLGARGGGSMADFDSLIELIQNTVATDTWQDVGRAATIEPFEAGVYVDPQGVLRRVAREDPTGDLAALRDASAPKGRRQIARQPSPLRKVSLTRLEKQVQLRLAAGRMPTEEMQVLAGLERVRYVLVYPETGDLVLAGPADDWTLGPEGRIVGRRTGRPAVRLDDLVVVLRHATAGPERSFGCSINPRQEALARVQEFLRQSSQRPLRPGERPGWLERLRAQLGQQDVEVDGLDPRTRAARVMVEADYRMKLVGMGLEEGVPGVVSYLDLIEVAPGQAPPPLGVLRWWFTLSYDAVLAAPDRRAFALRGQGVRVMSENERLTAEGKRVHTGQSEQWNRQFAASFTEHFDALCEKYPVYGELRNVFDLALACALVREEGLAGKVAWHMTCFGERGEYPVGLGPAPRTVETVIGHRVIQQKHVVAGVSGGVRADPTALVARQAVAVDTQGLLDRQRSAALPKRQLSGEPWWWD